MLLGHVVGRAWSDRQLPGLEARRFVVVRDLVDGSVRVAVDLMDVGVGATVLISTDEAASAASGVAVIDAAVVALVSSYEGVDRA